MGILTDAVTTLVSTALKSGLPLDPIAGGVIAVVGVDVLHTLIGATDAQAEMLTALDGKVDRLIAGPWQTARLYLQDMRLTDRSDRQLLDDLVRARAALFEAIPLQPERTWARAAVHIDLCLVSAALGDRAGTIAAARAAVEHGSPGLLLATAQQSLHSEGSRTEPPPVIPASTAVPVEHGAGSSRVAPQSILPITVVDLIEMGDTLALLLDACRADDPAYHPEIPLCLPSFTSSASLEGSPPPGAMQRERGAARLRVHVWWTRASAERVAGILAESVAEDYRRSQQRNGAKDGSTADARVWAVAREPYGASVMEGWYDAFIVVPLVREAAAPGPASESGGSTLQVWRSRVDVARVKQWWDPALFRDIASRPMSEWNPFRDRAHEQVRDALSDAAHVKLPHVKPGFIDQAVGPYATDAQEQSRAVLVHDASE